MSYSAKFNDYAVVPINKNTKGAVRLRHAEILDLVRKEHPEYIETDNRGEYVGWKAFQTIKYPRHLLNTWKGNFAVICGSPEYDWDKTLVVVDIDDYKRSKEFLELFPKTYTETTPSNGYHLFYRIDENNAEISEDSLIYKGKEVSIEIRGSTSGITLIVPSRYKEKHGKQLVKPKKVYNNGEIKSYKSLASFAAMLKDIGFSINKGAKAKQKTVCAVNTNQRSFKLDDNGIELIVKSIVDTGIFSEGKRQKIALAISGVLLKLHIKAEDIKTIISRICQDTGDTDEEERLTAVQTTIDNGIYNSNGKTALMEFIADKLDAVTAATVLQNFYIAAYANRDNMTPPDMCNCVWDVILSLSYNEKFLYKIFDALMEYELFIHDAPEKVLRNIAKHVKNKKIFLIDDKFYSPMYLDSDKFKELEENAIGHHLTEHFIYHWSKKDVRMFMDFMTLHTDFNISKIGLNNGCFNRSTLEFYEESVPIAYFNLPRNYLTEPLSEMTLTERTIRDILGANEEDTPSYVNYLEFLGYIFSYGVNFEKFLIIFGPAGGGKSILLDILGNLVSEYISSLTLTNLGASNFNAENLIGKLVNTMGDIPKEDFKPRNLEMMQSIVSKETMTINRKYKSGVELSDDLPVLIGAANTLPYVQTTDKEAVYRRMLLVRTYNRYREAENGIQPEGTKPLDTALKMKLKEDSLGLDWLFTEAIKRFKVAKQQGNFSFLDSVNGIGKMHEKYSKPANWIIEQITEYDLNAYEDVDKVIEQAMDYYEHHKDDIYQDLDHSHFHNDIKFNRALEIVKKQIHRNTYHNFVRGLRFKDQSNKESEYIQLWQLSINSIMLMEDSFDKTVIMDLIKIKTLLDDLGPDGQKTGIEVAVKAYPHLPWSKMESDLFNEQLAEIEEESEDLGQEESSEQAEMTDKQVNYPYAF